MLKITNKVYRANIIVIAIMVSVVISVGTFDTVKADREILFPVLGVGRFSDDFNSPRGNTKHNATDIFADKHTPILAAVDGMITYVAYPQPSYGYMIQITDSEGYEYNYIHINNDTPGTDDGRGGEMNAYAADMKQGNRVVKGQFIGWVGDSGNAESTAPHLHFEIYAPDGTPINPFSSLINAPHKFSLDRYDYPSLASESLPFDKFTGGVNITYGNVIAGAAKELIVGAGSGGGPHIKIYNNDMSFSGSAFFAYDQNFPGGVDVASGDVNGDGVDEIITGAGPGGGPHVKVFSANGQEIGGFFPYDAGFTGGVDVAVGDVTGTTLDEIVTAAGETGGSHVRTFMYDGAQPQNNRFTALNGFFAYDNFYGGVRVSVGNRLQNTNKSEIMTIPKNQGLPHVKVFDGSGNYLNGRMFMEEWWVGFYDIAAGDNTSRAAAGFNRRVTVRLGY